MDNIEIEYQLSRSDYLNFIIHHFDNTSDIQKKIRFRRFFVILLLFIPFIVGGLRKLTDNQFDISWYLYNLPLWPVIIAFVILYYIFSPYFIKKIYIRKNMKLYDDDQNSKSVGLTKIIVSKTEIRDISEHEEVTVKWDDIKKIDIVDEYIFIYFRKDNAFPIPFRVFRDNSHKNDFINAINSFYSNVNTRSPPPSTDYQQSPSEKD